MWHYHLLLLIEQDASYVHGTGKCYECTIIKKEGSRGASAFWGSYLSKLRVELLPR